VGWEVSVTTGVAVTGVGADGVVGILGDVATSAGESVVATAPVEDDEEVRLRRTPATTTAMRNSAGLFFGAFGGGLMCTSRIRPACIAVPLTVPPFLFSVMDEPRRFSDSTPATLPSPSSRVNPIAPTGSSHASEW
jgi:hypothetical protein